MTAPPTDPIRAQAEELHALCDCGAAHAYADCHQVNAIEEALTAARQDERRKTLEEAAAVLDAKVLKHGPGCKSFCECYGWQTLRYVAQTIRALADPSPEKVAKVLDPTQDKA